MKNEEKLKKLELAGKEVGMIYRGLKFRPSVRHPGALEVWDTNREKWFYTSLIKNKKELDYYLTEREGHWGRTMEVSTFDVKSLELDGSVKFVY